MLKRSMVVAVGVVSLGAACTVPSIGVPCSLNLNSPEFGFALTMPAGFACGSVVNVPTPVIVAWVNYVNSAADSTADVIVVANSGGDGNGNGAEPPGQSEDLGEYTSTGNIVFGLAKTTSQGQTTYAGVTELSGQRLLFVGLRKAGDDASQLDVLKSILDTVQKL